MSNQQVQQVADPARRTEMAVVGALWDGLASEWASVAPRAYPDGSPYLAEQHLKNLARVAAEVTFLRWPEADAVVEDITIVMAMVRDAHLDGPRREQGQALVDACTALVQRGLVRQAGFVAAVGVDVDRYHAQCAN